MGEHKYTVLKHVINTDIDKEVEITFSQDSSLGCLCTFPHNDKAFLPLHKEGGGFDKERVRSLAYLGAMVALVSNSDTEVDIDKNLEVYNSGEEEYRYLYLPQDLPDWVRRNIDLALVDKGGL